MNETSTIPTTPFPLFEYGVKNRLAKYEVKEDEVRSCMYDRLGTGKHTVMGRELKFGLNECRAEKHAALSLASPTHISAGMMFETSFSTAERPERLQRGVFVDRKEMGAALLPATPIEKTDEYDMDLVPGARCRALAHAKRALFDVQARLVSVLVQQLRATAEGESSRPIHLPEREWFAASECVQLGKARCIAEPHTATETADDYPVASFYAEAEYDWTTEGYEAREALKRFSK